MWWKKKAKYIQLPISITTRRTLYVSILLSLQSFLFFLQDQDGTINLFKLPGPGGVVQEGPQVEPVVVGAIRLCVVRWCQRGHLVTVDRVVKEEPLHLHRDLIKKKKKKRVFEVLEQNMKVECV